jgi:hypothetical protein
MNKDRRTEINKAIGMLQEALSILETARDEEQEYYDNTPESLQGSEPDLLAALQATMRALGDLPSTQKPGTRTRAAYDDARAAIAKATGV